MLEKLLKKNPINEMIDEEIRANFECLAAVDVNSGDYSKIMRNIERLEALKKRKDIKALDPNSCLVVAGNLVGILLILGTETFGDRFIRSKALGFVLRGRV